MGRFEQAARQAWQDLAPTALAEMTDPSQFFQDLEKDAEAAWAELAVQLAGPGSPGETYFQRVGRLEAAKLRALEMILADWCRPPAEVIEVQQGEVWPDPTSLLVHQLAEELKAAAEE
jgi:hypothetical protein